MQVGTARPKSILVWVIQLAQQKNKKTVLNLAETDIGRDPTKTQEAQALSYMVD